MDQHLQMQQKILDAIVNLGKIIAKDRDKDQQEVEDEAKKILAGHLATVRAAIDDSLEEPEEPRSLDKEDPKDRKVLAAMNEILDRFSETLEDGDESEDDDEDEEDAEGSEEDVDDDEESTYSQYSQ